jgi:hypothetical protein
MGKTRRAPLELPLASLTEGSMLVVSRAIHAPSLEAFQGNAELKLVLSEIGPYSSYGCSLLVLREGAGVDLEGRALNVKSADGKVSDFEIIPHHGDAVVDGYVEIRGSPLRLISTVQFHDSVVKALICEGSRYQARVANLNSATDSLFEVRVPR